MKIKTIIILFSLFLTLSLNFSVYAAEIRDIYFPTERDIILTDSFGDGRYDHTHEGVDIMGEQMMELYSAINGRVKSLVIPESYYGYAVTLEDAEGYTYHYLHVNNDTPGTDDGMGGVENAYAPGIERGTKVTKGQLIGWMGDSGNAENVGPHLHFEIRASNGTAIDPYPSLLAALNQGSYDREEATAASPSINIDKGLATGTKLAVCNSGSLIKLEAMDTVYYCGADGKRYVFPSDKIYFTWYEDFSEVTVISPEEMASLPIGGNATYRPGIRMVKIMTDPKVYAVGRGGILRWVQSAELAADLYGEDWNTKIDDIPDSFFFSYTIGEPILSAG